MLKNNLKEGCQNKSAEKKLYLKNSYAPPRTSYFSSLYYNENMNKTDKKPKNKNLYWIVPVVIVIFVSVGFVWNWQTNKTTSDVSPASSSQVSTSIPSFEESPIDVNTPSDNTEGDDKATDSRDESLTEAKKTASHVVPAKEVEITIPKSPLGDVEDPPDLNSGIQLNSIHKGIEGMSKNLEELEKELEKDPTNQGLKEEIERTKEIIEELKKEMEKLLNGDL